MFYSKIDFEFSLNDFKNSLITLVDTIACESKFVSIEELVQLVIFNIKINGVDYNGDIIKLTNTVRQIPDNILKLQVFDLNFNKYFKIIDGYFYELDMQYFEGKEIIEVPEGINLIRLENRQFKNTVVKEVHLPSTLGIIGDYALANTKSLDRVYVPDSVKKFGVGAFWGSAITEIRLPRIMKEWDNAVFGRCDNLKEVIVPDGLTSLTFRTFYESGIKHVVVGKDINSIDKDVFKFTRSLVNIDFSKAEDLYGIASESIWGCDSLKQLELPNSLEMVESYMVHYCPNLESLTLPANILSFKNVIVGCKELKNIYIKGRNAPLRKSFFKECNKNYSISYI